MKACRWRTNAARTSLRRRSGVLARLATTTSAERSSLNSSLLVSMVCPWVPERGGRSPQIDDSVTRPGYALARAALCLRAGHMSRRSDAAQGYTLGGEDVQRGVLEPAAWQRPRLY